MTGLLEARETEGEEIEIVGKPVSQVNPKGTIVELPALSVTVSIRLYVPSALAEIDVVADVVVLNVTSPIPPICAQ